MNYDNRLRKLEEQMPTSAPLDLRVCFVHAHRGVVAVRDKLGALC
ncbi:MAG TPA: hypothetical protein VKV24_15900 [Casimicrobiaceae bacterium]|nr:hypothetical protein [Casimicrobiaceae bacterium]